MTDRQAMLNARSSIAVHLCGFTLLLVACTEPQQSDKAPIPSEKGTTMTDNDALARLVEPLNSQLAAAIRSGQSRLEPLPTPFFGEGGVVKVIQLLPTRPVVYTVGYVGDFVVLLAGNPEGYFEIAQKASLHLENESLRTLYITTFLETTRSFAQRFQILRDAGEIKARPGLSESTAKSFAQKVDHQRGAIRPPSVTGDSAPWKSVVFALRGQNLIRLDIVLPSNGKLQIDETLLEGNLSIPYSL